MIGRTLCKNSIVYIYLLFLIMDEKTNWLKLKSDCGNRLPMPSKRTGNIIGCLQTN